MSEEFSNRARASILVTHELMQYACTIPEAEQEMFFDGRNCDVWMDGFIEHLQKRYQPWITWKEKAKP